MLEFGRSAAFLLAYGIATIGNAPCAAAQRAGATVLPQAVVDVRTADATDRPLAGVEVAAVRGLSDVISSARTDARGVAIVRVPRDSDDVQIIARRIGYQRADRFLRATFDSTTVRFTMAGAQLATNAQTLAPVSVTAKEDVKRKSYFVDADEIANSKRLILNGMDVLTKMKPDILEGRAPGCGVREIWVNGERIVNPPRDEVAIAHMPPRRGARFGTGPPSADEAVWSIMWSIQAEHIEQMDYKDCFDTSMPGLHANRALYVTLKPGVAFEPGRGSYVVDSVTAGKPPG